LREEEQVDDQSDWLKMFNKLCTFLFLLAESDHVMVPVHSLAETHAICVDVHPLVHRLDVLLLLHLLLLMVFLIMDAFHQMEFFLKIISFKLDFRLTFSNTKAV